MRDSSYGLSALNRALNSVDNSVLVAVLRVDFLSYCSNATSAVRDVSSEMMALASARYPGVQFSLGDSCTWNIPERYDLITAWGSTFHLALESHRPVMERLCGALTPRARVLAASCGV